MKRNEWQNSAYASLPLAGRSQSVVGPPGVALQINESRSGGRAAAAVHEKAGSLREQEVLPDVPGIADMSPVVVCSHQASSLSLQVHLFSDIEGLGGAGHCDLLGVVK